MSSRTNRGAKNNSRPVNVFLIIEGKRVFPLNKNVIRIGRKKDNDIILTNQHVSRHHAEIRFQDGAFHLIDLKSTVGTSVNGTRVTETILKTGDVISLGGVPLIFGQGKGEINIDEYQTNNGVSLPNTGPTDAQDLRDADSYLDYFRNDS
jgi:pSer/pThr/pTyr-binding forkhead associated (FHA) protein